MENKKLDFLIVLFSIFTIFGLSISIFAEESFSVGDLDRDKDGILDEDDQCPEISENYNRFEDTDGCPDSITEKKTIFEFPDADGDGFEDRVDGCIYLPENFNDYLDYDGCPEIIPETSERNIDSDSDTIPDTIDACPNEREIINEFKDADGCPDSLNPASSENFKRLLSYSQCLDGKIPVLRINSQNTVCVYLDIAQKWEEYGIGEILQIPVVEEADDSEIYPVDVISISKPEIISPESSDQLEILPKLTASEDVSTKTILDTDKTVIGQEISYASGSPHIISKIVTIPVGSETGYHIHEYPMFAYVMEGEIIVDYGDEGIKTFVKGDSLVEAINYDHNGKNMGKEPAKVLVVLMGEN